MVSGNNFIILLSVFAGCVESVRLVEIYYDMKSTPRPNDRSVKSNPKARSRTRWTHERDALLCTMSSIYDPYLTSPNSI